MTSAVIYRRLIRDAATRVEASLARHPQLREAAEILILLAAFIAVDRFLMKLSRMPQAGFEEPWLLGAWLSHLDWPLLIVCTAGFAVLCMSGVFRRPWHSFDDGRKLRCLVVFLAAVIAWPLTTYGYNYYFDQAHLADRFSLILLLALLWWRPVFIFPFVLLAYTILWQFGLPELGGTIFPHKLQVLHLLNLFAAFFALACLSGERRIRTFVYLSCCLVAAAYWVPALGKWQIGWLQHVRLDLILPAAHEHGWLQSVAAHRIAALARFVHTINLPLALLVLVFETACLLFFFTRRLSLMLLAAAILFHAGIFALYGFFFWTWMMIDAAVLIFLYRMNPAELRSLYARPLILLSIALIGIGEYWAQPPKLAWHDTRLNYTYFLHFIDPDGRTTRQSPGYFSPYEDIFTMMPFFYLVEQHKFLVGSYGVTQDGKTAVAINELGSPADIPRLEESFGEQRFDPHSAARYREFISRYVTNRLQRGPQLTWLHPVSAPAQFWGYGAQVGEQAPDVDSIIVEEVTTFFDGNTAIPVRRIEVMRIAIPRWSTST